MTSAMDIARGNAAARDAWRFGLKGINETAQALFDGKGFVDLAGKPGKSGSGKKVTSKKQAIAIGLSEARKEGGKVPKKKIFQEEIFEEVITRPLVSIK